MKATKLTQLTNKELMESVLQMIRDLGYTVKNEIMGNSYFLFEGEENSVCWFYIKEIPRV